ncbi:transglutaminaseTgpA domain-containing protein [Yinghuangia sp. ASG 101]|uniref:DUF3488 and transglutaminase-like domain-containing protein n=1 Tax=Yinghuangia sp. ASG 101 TaxID=2896848 RepID=UPI001E5D79DB|nr:transglutaminaseTgpA domain-containing protein [Yinghuangia sp. ASG 101]UGQ09030.1 transglutaminaseTgpA domain-containing protein [Yinghuangia sp. ASG 101]
MTAAKAALRTDAGGAAHTAAYTAAQYDTAPDAQGDAGTGAGARNAAHTRLGPPDGGSPAAPAVDPSPYRSWSLLPVAVLAWSTGLAYLPVFGLDALLPVITAASVAPVLLAFAVSSVLRYPAWSAGALSALGALVGACATLYRDEAVGGVLPTPSLARELGRALVDAPPSLLGVILPAPAEPRLLVLVFATVWAVGYAGAELALRTGGRALPVLPAVVPLAGVPLLGIGGKPPTTPVLGAAVVAAGAVILVRSPAGPERAARLLLGVPLAAGAALAAVLTSAVLPGASRQAVDLRGHVGRPPSVEVEGLSPLDRISAWLRDPDRPMFSVAAPDAAPDQLWRLTVFDRYDGVAWRPVRNLEPSGGHVPGAAETTATTRRLAQDITLHRLPGPWLPAAERPTDVDLADHDRIAVDRGSGVVADEADFTEGTRYTVVSDVPVYDPESVQFAPTADAPGDIALPALDAAGGEIAALAALRDLAQRATEGSGFPYQQALRLAEWLRANHTFDPDAVPGHGYRNLQFFLEAGKTGTSEQFAAAFAVLARTLNLPARVVVGFRSPPAVDGVVHVRAGDVLAWAEVRFAGVGWVPFFPTPAQGQATHVVPPPPPSAPEETPPDEAAASEQHPEQDRADLDARIRDEERASAAQSAARDGDGSSWWIWLTAACAAIAAAVPSVTRGARALRRGRRRSGPPDRRILGAWAQAEEQLRRLGMPSAEAMTAHDVAAYGRRRLGDRAGEALHVLAGIHNELLYGEPADKRPDDKARAALAWRCCREVEAAARTASAVRTRWRPIRVRRGSAAVIAAPGGGPWTGRPG